MPIIYFKGTIESDFYDKSPEIFFKYRDIKSQRNLENCNSLSKCFLYKNNARLTKSDMRILIDPWDDQQEDIPRFTIIKRNLEIPSDLLYNDDGYSEEDSINIKYHKMILV